MMKRIAEWEERAERLRDDISQAMPAQYREHDLLKGKFRNGKELHHAMMELFDRDILALAWIEMFQHAAGLCGALSYLAVHIEGRARRNGLRLDSPGMASEPIEAKPPGALEGRESSLASSGMD